MTDAAQTAGGPARARRGRVLRWARRIGFLAGWLLAVGLCLLLLLGGAFWWAASHPTQVARMGLDLFAPGKGIAIESIDLGTPGVVELRGLDAAGDGTTGGAVHLESVRVEYSGSRLGFWRDARIDGLEIEGGRVAIDDALLAKWLPASEGGGAADVPGADGAEAEQPAWLQRVLPERVKVSGLDVSVALEDLPQLAGTVEFQSDSFRELVAGETRERVHTVQMTNGSWTGEGEQVPVAFDKLDLQFSAADAFRKIEIASAEVTGLKARLTPEGMAEFLRPADEPPTGGSHPEIGIGKMVAKDAELDFRGFDNLPAVSARADFEIAGLRIAEGRLRSGEEQDLVLRGTEIVAPGAAGGVLLKWDRAQLRAVPDALLERGEVAKLHLQGLEVNVSKETLGSLLDLVPGTAASTETVGPPAATAEERRRLVVRDLRVAGGVLNFDPQGLFAGLPAATAKLELRSEGETPEGDVKYAAELTDIAVRENAAATKPFASGAKVLATFRALGLQRDGLIDSVELNGVRAEVGEEIARLAEAASGGAAGAVPASPEPVEDAKPPEDEVGAEGAGSNDGLSISKLEIHNTAITLRDLIPGALPYLTISLDTTLEAVPLIGRSRGDEREQRIELKGLQLASPYNPLQNVAELKTVWIYFTIPGLLRSEIRRVEIVSPDIYVGEPLFWYVDYARKYAAGEPLEGEPVAAGAEGEGGEEGEPGAPDAIVDSLKAFELSGWKLGELSASAGRIIIAPTGVPLGIVPFPFEANTDFAKGEVSLEVKVPIGDYVFEQLELELRQLFGEAYVNYPPASRKNNFVQTFESPLVKFQQFEGSEVWLSVTYNQEGIYGELGGRAYGGYVNGGFNIYVKGPYAWKAWVSGTDLDLGAFTDVLAPDSFRMAGVIDECKFIAEGQGFVLQKAEGDFATRGGGTMHVLKLDDVIESLPEDWDPLWKALSRAGIDAFRNYRFASGKADLNYEAGEGEAHILFDGDEGKRDLLLRLFDRRGERDVDSPQ